MGKIAFFFPDMTNKATETKNEVKFLCHDRKEFEKQPGKENRQDIDLLWLQMVNTLNTAADRKINRGLKFIHRGAEE